MTADARAPKVAVAGRPAPAGAAPARLLALVPAAGRGERFGAGRTKMFVELAGRPVLAWTVERLLAAGVDRVAVALSYDCLAAGPPAGVPVGERVIWTAGGATRQESVEACLAAVPGPPDDLLLVHDGARPAVSLRDLRSTVAAALESGGAILGRPVSDTLKRVRDGRVERTVDRGRLFRAETPQVFRRRDLAAALEAARRDGFVGTDEASLVERLEGVVIAAVAARDPNPKLTTVGDVPVLELLLAGEAKVGEAATLQGVGEEDSR